MHSKKLLIQLCKFSVDDKPSPRGPLFKQQRDAMQLQYLTTQEICDALLQGRAWYGFSQSVRDIDSPISESFQSANIICLDYDSPNESMWNKLDRAWAYGLMPAFGYTTFSHTDDAPRYRLAWALQSDLNTTISQCNEALKKLDRSLGDDADKNCLSCLKHWQGTSPDAEYFAIFDSDLKFYTLTEINERASRRAPY